MAPHVFNCAERYRAPLRRKLAEALGFRGPWDEDADGKVSHGMI
jgi:hypothetical protein